MANVVVPKHNGVSTLVTPDGEVAIKANVPISFDDANLLRSYKKLLMRLGLREALYCQSCWNSSQHDGCRAHVTDTSILIECRCKTRFFQGASY